MVWVDDYGSLKLRKKDADWYHQHAGPMSYAVECDDRFPWGFKVAFSSLALDLSAGDFFSHHVHPLRYVGPKTPKKVYDALRLHYLVRSLLRGIPKSVSKRIFRGALALGILGASAVLAYLFDVKSAAFVVLIIPCAFAIALSVVWYYVQLPPHWEDTFSDCASIASSILNAEAEFRKRGLSYPAVIRHGWNLPWEGSMQFYTKLGVSADASAVPIGCDRHPRIGHREIEWDFSQPYFASIANDYNVPWNGVDADDKGLLELPVNLGNISAYGFGEKEKLLIENVPEGGLVSCYIHPEDAFSPVKEWANHLKRHYDPRFVSALTAAEIYGSESMKGVQMARHAHDTQF